MTSTRVGSIRRDSGTRKRQIVYWDVESPWNTSVNEWDWSKTVWDWDTNFEILKLISTRYIYHHDDIYTNLMQWMLCWWKQDQGVWVWVRVAPNLFWSRLGQELLALKHFSVELATSAQTVVLLSPSSFAMNFFKTKQRTPPDLIRGLRDAIPRLESGAPGGETRRKVRKTLGISG